MKLKISLERFIRILVLYVLVCALSCKKKEETRLDEYYVKYQVNSSTIYYGGKLNVVISGENNQIKIFSIDTRTLWEATIGPVNRGFEAKMTVNEATSNYGQLKLYTQVSASKNSSPFALKKSDNSDLPRTSAQVSYTVDY